MEQAYLRNITLLIVPFYGMFLGMRNTPTFDPVLKQALARVQSRLPTGWRAEEQSSVQGGRALSLEAPEGRAAKVALVVRKGLVPRDVASLVAAAAGKPLLVVSSFLGPKARELLAQAHVSYADATGNLRVVLSKPSIFLEGVGAKQDPERAPRSLHSLRGAAAGRVVRALCEFAPPLGLRALAGLTGASLGTLSRVVALLEAELMLERGSGRQIVSVDWAGLLTRWATDYGVATTNRMRPYLEPRGLGALWPKLSRLPRYAVTGSAVGSSAAPTALAMVYVEDSEAAARALDLVPAAAGANVWLLQPYDEVVFERTRKKLVSTATMALETVAVSMPQTVVDLLTSPGRGPQEAEALLRQMKTTGNEWRRGT